LPRVGRTKVVKPRNRTGEAIAERWYEPPRLKVPVDPRRDHIAGPVNASLTLLEYGDFQCPFCAAAVPEIKKAQRELDSQMRFVFRHFPMTSVHRFAAKAAEMAEAAGAQGKFWEMHDLLFAKQDMLGDDAYILDYAEALGNKYALVVFDECHHLPSEFTRVIAEYSLAPYRLGLTATLERSDGKHTDLQVLIGPEVYRTSAAALSWRSSAVIGVASTYVSIPMGNRRSWS